jgi:hypothetical protein
VSYLAIAGNFPAFDADVADTGGDELLTNELQHVHPVNCGWTFRRDYSREEVSYQKHILGISLTTHLE